jgi:hypothetical protein
MGSMLLGIPGWWCDAPLGNHLEDRFTLLLGIGWLLLLFSLCRLLAGGLNIENAQPDILFAIIFGRFQPENDIDMVGAK